jgi:hypothetical protein
MSIVLARAWNPRGELDRFLALQRAANSASWFDPLVRNKALLHDRPSCCDLRLMCRPPSARILLAKSRAA